MVTRQQRLSEFVTEGEPPRDQKLELLCEDHNGTFVMPFGCCWVDHEWRNAVTGVAIAATVLGWR